MNLTDDEFYRFANKTKVDPATKCRLWIGPLDKDGYGTFFFRRKNRRAHRVAWYSEHGEIGNDLVINHKCRNRNCVNPDHLERVTKTENVFVDSQSIPAINSRKTHCPNGHAYDRKYGKQRYCSICEAAKKKRLRAKWAAEDKLEV